METIPPMISIRWKEKLPACISKDGKVPARIPPTVTLIFQRVLKEKKFPPEYISPPFTFIFIKGFKGEKNSRQNIYLLLLL